MLEIADDAVIENELEGIVQIAPFHPDFQFEGTEADDISNYTNRSPYPTLHLIREDSIAKAAEAFPDASAIFDRNIALLEKMGHEGRKIPAPQLWRNIALLEKMGHEGWDKLDIPRCPFPHHKPSENK